MILTFVFFGFIIFTLSYKLFDYLIVDEIQAEELVSIITNQTVHVSLISRNDEAMAASMLEHQDKVLKSINTQEQFKAQSQTEAQ